MLSESQKKWIQKKITTFIESHPLADMIPLDKAKALIADANEITKAAKNNEDIRDIVQALVAFYGKVGLVLSGIRKEGDHHADVT